MATRTRTSKSNKAQSATPTAARARTARSSRSSRVGTAVSRIEEKVPSATRRVLEKSRVAVPLLVAVGLGAAVVRKLLRGRHDASAFRRSVKHLPAKIGEAIQALAALGRDVRSSVSR